jgi:hypothetical protein
MFHQSGSGAIEPVFLPSGLRNTAMSYERMSL